MMKKTTMTALAMTMISATLSAQEADSTAFRAYLYDTENDVYMDISLRDQDVVVKGQEVFGKVAGYLARKGNSFCWLITSAEISGRRAELEMVNDYGSDDLTATLTQVNDTTYTLEQRDGATLKVPVGGKWKKLPRQLTLRRRK